ncbi:MAG: hypothetical protein RRA92_07285 [Gemmatimonadota bacterium]|nr:hypothetical protein [Gemmatimonadota bacterium]
MSEGGKKARRRNTWLTPLLLGIVLGGAGTALLPGIVRPYLPAGLRGENVEVSGVVEAKSRDPDRLLLTIGGAAGAVLVTYTEKIAEIDLLVEPGDSVVLGVREYAPFVTDPSIRRVQKASEFERVERRRPAAADDAADEEGAVQRRPRLEEPAPADSGVPGDGAGLPVEEADEPAAGAAGSDTTVDTPGGGS